MSESPANDDKPVPWWSRPWAVVIWLTAFAAAAVAFLNGVPQFVDETLPWLGERIRIGEIDPTVWDITTAAVGAATAGFAVAAVRGLRTAERRLLEARESIRRIKEAEAKEHHTLAAVGGTTATCSCGWRGPGWDWEKHRRVGT